jgi:hypothetical protein
MNGWDVNYLLEKDGIIYMWNQNEVTVVKETQNQIEQLESI